MRLNRLILVRLSPANGPAVLAAAGRAFPEAEIVEVPSLDEAVQLPPASRPELLVLAEPDAASAASAVQAVDGSGLPRWAVVLLGGDSADLAETVPAAEWQAPLLARVFRSALLQQELARENLRLRGDLKTVARRINHDLGAPIGCIGTASHVVKISLSPAALQPVEAMIRNIEESGREIGQIAERVSFVLRASVEASVPVQVEMAEVVAGVLRQLKPEIQETGAAVAVPAAWPEVIGMAAWLHVIWWNLLHNALQHGGPAPQVQLAWAPEAGGSRFWVANRGAAIPPAIQARLFRPFEQLHLFPAPGLGLSIVHRLVVLQGGRCGYERREDGSSVFSFTLPAAAGRRAGRSGV